MKILVVACRIHHNPVDASHGITEILNRLVIPEANHLVITPYKGHLYAYEGRGMPEGEILLEVEDGQFVADAAVDFLQAKHLLQQFLGDWRMADHFEGQLRMNFETSREV